MLKLRWLFLFFSLGVTAVLFYYERAGESRTAVSLLASADERLEGDSPDYGLALRELELALRIAKRGGSPSTVREVLLQRAETYRSLGEHELAWEDTRLVLENLEDDPEALELAARSALDSGWPDRALEAAMQLQQLAPDTGPGLVLLGQSHLGLARQSLGQLRAQFERENPRSQAARLSRLARRAATLSTEAPQRITALEEVLRGLPDEQERQAAGELIRQASEHMAAARRALVRSLALEPTGEAVAGIQDVYLDAEMNAEVVDIGQAALALDGMSESTPVLARAVRALEAMDRPILARRIVERHIEAEGPIDHAAFGDDDELRDWCFLLDRIEAWSTLRDAAIELRQRSGAGLVGDLRLAWTFEGLSTIELSQAKPNMAHFARFPLEKASENPPAALPYADLRIWLARAMLERLSGPRRTEHFSLLQATKVDTSSMDDPRLRGMMARGWLRLAEIQEEDGELLNAESSLTHALRFHRAPPIRLLSQWVELGRKAITRRGRDPEEVVARLTSGAPGLEYGRIGPYEAWLQAFHAAENRNWGLATYLAEELLRTYPGLEPARSVLSKSEFQLGSYPAAIAVSLGLLEDGVIPRGIHARLNGIPLELYSAEDRVRWIRLAPRSAAIHVIGTLMKLGRHEDAAAVARHVDASSMGEERVASLTAPLAAVRDWAACHERIERLPENAPSFASLAGLAVRAAARSSQPGDSPQRLRDVVERVIRSEAFLAPDLAQSADALVAAGRVELAREFLESLDARSLGLGEVILQLAAVALVEPDGLERARETLDRADAFFDGGDALVGRLLLAIEEDDPGTRRDLAVELTFTRFGEEPMSLAMLQALAGNGDAAREALDRLPASPDDFLGTLARGVVDALTPGNEDDPRQALPEPVAESFGPEILAGFLLTRELRPWASWGLARVRALDEPQRDALPFKLLAMAFLEGLDEENRLWAELEGLPPAEQADVRVLYLRESLLRARDPDPASWIATAVARRRAGGAGFPTPTHQALVDARSAEEDGDPEAGLRLLRAALVDVTGEGATLPRGDFDARGAVLLELARLERRLGYLERSLEHYLGVLTRDRSDPAPEVVIEALELLDEARNGDLVSDGVWWAEVEALEALLPRDPAIARALAAETFHSRDGNRSSSALHTLERLDRFRERTRHVPVESLRRGEARRWCTLLLELDPARALSFAEQELLALPTHPDLWFVWVLAQLANDRPWAALEDLSAILELLPDAELSRKRLILDYELKRQEPELRQAIQAWSRTYPGELDPELTFFRGIAALREAHKSPEEVRRDLGAWDEREANGLDPGFHGRLYSLALLEVKSFPFAGQVLGEAARAVDDPVDKDLLLAMRSLVLAHVRAMQEAEQEEPAPDGDVEAEED